MNVLKYQYRQISPSTATKIFFPACTRVRSTSNGKTTAQVKSAAEAPAVAVWRAVRLSGIISRNVPQPVDARWGSQAHDKMKSRLGDHFPHLHHHPQAGPKLGDLASVQFVQFPSFP